MGKNTSKMVELAEYPSLMEAEVVKGMLETNGIEAMVTEQYNPYGQAYAYSKVIVMDYDLEAAKKLLESEQ
ncbi:MAG: putative signal transducing protein [Muribaculaceae bacterium]